MAASSRFRKTGPTNWEASLPICARQATRRYNYGEGGLRGRLKNLSFGIVLDAGNGTMLEEEGDDLNFLLNFYYPKLSIDRTGNGTK